MRIPEDMSIRWRIPFKGLDGTAYCVNIYDRWDGEPATLVGAADPFTVDESDDNDPFVPIRTQTGLISFIDDGSIAPEMLSDTPLNRPVVLTADGEVEWAGFLQCESMEQPYADPIHEISIGVECPLSLLAAIEIDQPKDGLGFVSINSVVHEAAGKVMMEVLQDIAPDWGEGAWTNYVVRSKWLEFVDYDTNAVKPFVGNTYYEVLSDILSYIGAQAFMHKGDIYIGKIDESSRYAEPMVPAWNSTDHSRNFLSGVRRVMLACDPEESDESLASIPDDESHTYDLRDTGHSPDGLAYTAYAYEHYCQPGMDDYNWYAYSSASGYVPPISNHAKLGSTDNVMFGGIFEELSVTTVIGEDHYNYDDKGMLFSGLGNMSREAFRFRNIVPIATIQDMHSLKIEMGGYFINRVHLTKVEDTGTGYVIPMDLTIRYAGLYLRKANIGEGTSLGYVWDATPSTFRAYLGRDGDLCWDVNSEEEFRNIDVLLPEGSGYMDITINTPRLPQNGRLGYYFATKFKASVTVPENRQRPHRQKHDYDFAYVDTKDLTLNLGCARSMRIFSVAFLYYKDRRGKMSIVSDYYETELFNRLVRYYASKHHTLKVNVGMDDYSQLKRVTVDGTDYTVLYRSYDYRNSLITLTLINID